MPIFIQQFRFDNLTIHTVNTNLSYPAGNYKTEYWLRNSDGFLKYTIYHVYWSKDNQEY